MVKGTHQDASPRRILVGLAVAAFFAWMSYELVRSPVLSLFAAHLGLGPREVGFVLAASTITGIFLKFPAGVLSDLYSRRRLLLLAAGVFALGPLGYLWIDSGSSLTLWRFVHGMATAIYGPVALATLATLFQTRRAESLSWYSAAGLAGGLLGPLLGGFLVQHMGFVPAFLGAAASGSLALLAVWYLPPSPALEPTARGLALEEIRSRFWQEIREVAGDLQVLVSGMTQGVQFLAIGTLQAFLPLYGLSVGLRETQVGVLFSVQAVMTLSCRPLLGRLSDRMGRRPVILSGLLFTALSIGALGWLETFPSLVGFSIVMGLGTALVTSSAAALVADLCRERHYGSGMGVFGAVMDIGHASGPLVSGLLVALLGYQGAFVGVGLMLLGFGFLFHRVVREPVREPEARGKTSP